MSEIVFPQLGYMMTIDSRPPDDRLFEITHFARFDYSQFEVMELRLPVLPTHLWIPGDYRTREEILEQVQRSGDLGPEARTSCRGRPGRRIRCCPHCDAAEAWPRHSVEAAVHVEDDGLLRCRKREEQYLMGDVRGQPVLLADLEVEDSVAPAIPAFVGDPRSYHGPTIHLPQRKVHGRTGQLSAGRGPPTSRPGPPAQAAVLSCVTPKGHIGWTCRQADRAMSLSFRNFVGRSPRPW